MIPWNQKYPTQNGEMINLDWVISEVKRLNQNMDELEARVLAAALKATKEYVDTELVSIREEFAELTDEVSNLRIYFDEKIAELDSNYDTFILAVRNELNTMTRRIEQFETTVQNEIIAVNALTDLKIEANNEYILDEVAKGVVNVRVLNYFTGEYVTVQEMFNTLAELHLENPISYTELASANITYTALAALNMTYTELAIKGKSFIIP
jgi:hypothetical protein